MRERRDGRGAGSQSQSDAKPWRARGHEVLSATRLAGMSNAAQRMIREGVNRLLESYMNDTAARVGAADTTD